MRVGHLCVRGTLASWILWFDDGMVEGGLTYKDLRGDVFVRSRHIGDIWCLFRGLPLENLVELAQKGETVLSDGSLLRYMGKCGTFLLYEGARRKLTLALYDARSYDVDGAEEEEFKEFLDNFDCRLTPPSIAKDIMWRELHVSRYFERFGLFPTSAQVLAFLHGHACGFDTRMIGFVPSAVKVDRKLAYLSALAELPYIEGEWVEGHEYTPDDLYGLYCVDVRIPDDLVASPLFVPVPVEMRTGFVLFPFVGEISGAWVFEPVMKLLVEMKSNQLCDRLRVRQSYALRSGNGPRSSPFRNLVSIVGDLRAHAGMGDFAKLIGTSMWGKLLECYVERGSDGSAVNVAGPFFCPFLAYTATDLIKADVFRFWWRSGFKLYCSHVDSVWGPEGDWVKYAGESYHVERVPSTFFLNDVRCVRSDKEASLYERICTSTTNRLLLTIVGRGTYGELRNVVESNVDDRKLFGLCKVATLLRISSKRRFGYPLSRLRMCDLKSTQLFGRLWDGSCMSSFEARISPDFGFRGFRDRSGRIYGA